jgi:ribonuclease HII
MTRTAEPTARIGIDENGLGPRLGPLIVTATLAEVDARGARQLSTPLPASLKGDLDDSKRLVSCHDASLGEAWARAICSLDGQAPAATPAALFSLLCHESPQSLKSACPPSTLEQCWNVAGEQFTATDAQVARITGQLMDLEKRGIKIRRVSCDVTCTGRLNQLKDRGVHRLAADLHGMERLILQLQGVAQAPVIATCGKVGGIAKYGDFFGPLAGRLHTPLVEGRAESCYYFPTLGEIRFVRDADASDALVMLSSLVGKYVRELLMKRISTFYASELGAGTGLPSGYHDPVTSAFVLKTEKSRKKLKIVQDCFERRGREDSAKRAKRAQ